MKGYVQLCSFEEAGNLNLDNFNVKLQIVLSIKKGLRTGFVHVPHLAPSKKLYNDAMYRWKKLKFTKEEKEKLSKGKTGTWWDLYEKRFVIEAKTRADFKIAYKRLKEHLDNGNNIILICYCEDGYRCHRSIVGNLLENDGYLVIYK